MKYWRGYLTAAIFALFTVVLQQFGQRYSVLVDMVYPYVTRSVQSFLAAWTGTMEGCVWQIALLLLIVVVLASLALVIVFRKNLIQWAGWVLAVASMVFFGYTCIYGLNHYSGPIEEDLRMEMVDYTQTELEEAAVFYRDQANTLAGQVNRDADGHLEFSDFDTLAAQTGDGFNTLTHTRSFSVMGGDYMPVKKLGWAGLYAGMGKSGFFCPLTGEAAVNPKTADVCIPFSMAREMAKRLCIAREDDASFAAFLNCQANSSVEYQYSGYFMAFRYCCNALKAIDKDAAAAVSEGCSEALARDLMEYENHFSSRKDPTAMRVGDLANQLYLKASGEERNTTAQASVCDYLVNWYIDEYTDPEEETVKFDPMDESQVDLSTTVNEITQPTEETEPEEE